MNCRMVKCFNVFTWPDQLIQHHLRTGYSVRHASFHVISCQVFRWPFQLHCREDIEWLAPCLHPPVITSISPSTILWTVLLPSTLKKKFAICWCWLWSIFVHYVLDLTGQQSVFECMIIYSFIHVVLCLKMHSYFSEVCHKQIWTIFGIQNPDNSSMVIIRHGILVTENTDTGP